MRPTHALLVLTACLAVACGDSPDGPKDGPASAAPAGEAPDTPAPARHEASAELEEVFGRAKDAFNHRDYRTLYGLLTKESREEMLTSVFLGATAVVAASDDPAHKAELERITEDHGVPEVDLDGADGRNPMDVLAEVLSPVQDPGGLLGDLLAFLERFQGAPTGRRMVGLENVTETADHASATIVYSNPTGTQQLEATEFRRVKGRWLLHLAQRKR